MGLEGNKFAEISMYLADKVVGPHVHKGREAKHPGWTGPVATWAARAGSVEPVYWAVLEENVSSRLMHPMDEIARRERPAAQV